MVTNPFVLKGYAGVEYFCGREKETENIQNIVKNGQDITLYAFRRSGKSALIQHVFHQMDDDERIGIFVDIWGSSSLTDFTTSLAEAVIQSSIFGKRSISNKMKEFIGGLGASISIGMDGLPSVDLLYQDKNKPFKKLEDILTFLNGTKKKVVLAIDEFQEIRRYEMAHPLEANLRKLMQRFQNITFIFSGSEYHILDDMFNNYKNPFYQSTRMMALEKIPEDAYSEFIKKHMMKGNKELDDEIIQHILDITHRHTYYVQAICHLIYSRRTYPKTIIDFDKLYNDFLEEKKVFYSEIPNRMTVKQFATLKVIASDRLVTSPTASAFLERVPAATPSSVQRIMQALLDKQLIIKDEGGYRLYDIFLEHYLKWKVV